MGTRKSKKTNVRNRTKKIEIIFKDVCIIAALASLFYQLITLLPSLPSSPKHSILTTESWAFITAMSIGVLTARHASSFIFRYSKTLEVIGYKSSFIINTIISLLLALIVSLFYSPSEVTQLLASIFLLLLGIFLFAVGYTGNRLHTNHTQQENDKLDREDFINKVVSILSGQVNLSSKTQEKAIILWISNHWGAGKTWALKEIKKKYEGTANTKNVIWFSFHPWLQSHANPSKDLTTSFFDQLANSINSRFYIEELDKNIIKYKRAIILEAKKRLFNAWSDEKDTVELKEDISTFLKENNLKLIITIDEIDRLISSEMVTCLKLIRSIANFSNTTIIVCGAHDKVKETLVKADLPPDYLEKISQVPIIMPFVKTDDLINLLWQYIDKDITEDTKNIMQSAFQNLHSNTALDHDLQSILNNVRIIQKLADIIKVDLLSKQDKIHDINVFDFINLSIIRLTCFSLYEEIRDNKNLCCTIESHLHKTGEEKKGHQEDFQKSIENAISGSGKKATQARALKKIVAQMFPFYVQSNATHHYIANSEQNRIRERHSFDRYFVENFPKGEVSSTEIQAIIKDWDNNEGIQKVLKKKTSEEILYIFQSVFIAEKFEIKNNTKKAIGRFIIEEHIRELKNGDNKYSSLNMSYVKFEKNEDYKEMLDLYLKKSSCMDFSFRCACDYFNTLYWSTKRREKIQISKGFLDLLREILIKEFESRFIKQGHNLFNLPAKDFHFYWYIFTRDNAAYNQTLKEHIATDIQENASKFYQYIHVFRQFAFTEPVRHKNDYTSNFGFTEENIGLAKSYLETNQYKDKEIENDVSRFVELASAYLDELDTGK